MVEKKPVNVKWQMLFVLIPFLDLYASYRIQKLRLWLLIFGVGFGIATFLMNYAIFGMHDSVWDFEIEVWDPTMTFFHIAVVIITLGSAVYVIRRWSITWNEKVS